MNRTDLAAAREHIAGLFGLKPDAPLEWLKQQSRFDSAVTVYCRCEGGPGAMPLTARRRQVTIATQPMIRKATLFVGRCRYCGKIWVAETKPAFNAPSV